MSYRDQKFPQRRMQDGKLVFFWQAAYADAMDYPHVLYGNIWDQLSRYDRRIKSDNTKEYDSADEAVRDMLVAWQKSGRDEDGIPVASRKEFSPLS